MPKLPRWYIYRHSYLNRQLFSGRNCELNTDDCVLNPCRNGGTCHDFTNEYQCVCPPGYIGKHCEENYDDCKTRPCANGGVCADGVNDFTCTCTPGYTGKDCSIEVNECDLDPCLNGGFCIDGNNNFTCRCLPRYAGIHCEILPDGTIDPKYYELRSVLPTRLPADPSGNMALIGTFSAVVPIGVIVAAVVVFCLKQKRKNEQRQADFEAQMENELNSVNSINKTKMLDDHMIVNSLDFPSSNGGSGLNGLKPLNTNPNLTNEDVFAAKESVYNQMGRSTKQLNTDCLMNSVNSQLNRQSFYGGGVDQLKLEGGGGARGVSRDSNNKPRLAKSNNLDLSSSTLCSSSR